MFTRSSNSRYGPREPTGVAAIVDAVQSLREHPPTSLGGLAVSAHFDLAHGYEGLGATDGVLLATR